LSLVVAFMASWSSKIFTRRVLYLVRMCLVGVNINIHQGFTWHKIFNPFSCNIFTNLTYSKMPLKTLKEWEKYIDMDYIRFSNIITTSRLKTCLHNQVALVCHAMDIGNEGCMFTYELYCHPYFHTLQNIHTIYTTTY